MEAETKIIYLYRDLLCSIIEFATDIRTPFTRRVPTITGSPLAWDERQCVKLTYFMMRELRSLLSPEGEERLKIDIEELKLRCMSAAAARAERDAERALTKVFNMETEVLR
jgi:hypothetical protein